MEATSSGMDLVIDGWFERWLAEDEQLPQEANHFALTAAHWPEADDPLCFLFAFHVYEVAQCWDDAARCCVTAARLDPTLRRSSLLRTVDAACRDHLGLPLKKVLALEHPEESIAKALAAAQESYEAWVHALH